MQLSMKQGGNTENRFGYGSSAIYEVKNDERELERADWQA